MENNFKELNERVINWADGKGILQKATPISQIHKTIEEVEETLEALYAQSLNQETYITHKGDNKSTKEEILDGFGDILVTILIGCKMQEINPLKALELALDIIEKRKGSMKNGVFVKQD